MLKAPVRAYSQYSKFEGFCVYLLSSRTLGYLLRKEFLRQPQSRTIFDLATFRVAVPVPTRRIWYRKGMSAELENATVVTPAPIPESTTTGPEGIDERGHPGLRKCAPYWHANKTFAKGRWLNREILEMISTEFRDRSVEYYKFALSSGVTRVNGTVALPGYIIQNGDIIENMRHRHEPPISSILVKIIHRDEENGFIVVDKPGGLPVHAAGRYYRHSLTEILTNDFGIEKPHTVNRLDRLTSGCMFIATTSKTARMLTEEMTAGIIRKEYVARCIGKFPEEEVVVEEPMLCVDRQMGLNIVHPEGKHAKTIFNRMFYDEISDTSVLHCQPLTGRSHQIRVHLQFIGHPIANDPVYSDPKVWGPSRGLGGLPSEPPTDELTTKVVAPSEVTSSEAGPPAVLLPSVEPIVTTPPSSPLPVANTPSVDETSPDPISVSEMPSTSDTTLSDPPNLAVDELPHERLPSPDLYYDTAISTKKRNPVVKGPKRPKGDRAPHLPPRFKSPPSKPFTSGTRGGVTNLSAGPSAKSLEDGGLLPRESGDDIGAAAPVALSPETVAVISALRNQKDETEEFSRWRDVIFRTKAALKIHGPDGVHEKEKTLVPLHVREQREEEKERELARRSATQGGIDTTESLQTPNTSSHLTNEGQLHASRMAGSAPPDDPANVGIEESFPYCEECFVPLYPDPKPSQLYIYLHALRYTTSKWSFATEMPFWAEKGWVPEA
ncbi:hypothetical protein FRB93_005956 [Tulasnella sp. JGI-2019a]|nr:hypothetical protein FRB93_005956 [Tulasnella sp. JGI-2019a]